MKSPSKTDIVPVQTKESAFSFAEALFVAGNEHRYQKRLAYLFSLQRISLGFLFTAFPFLFKQPKFHCRAGDHLDYVLCDPTPENCELDIIPVPGSDNNLITHFGLYCDYASYGNMAKNLFTAGCTIGILLIIPLADKIGRRPGLIVSYILGAISVFLLAFSNEWSNFGILLTVAGLGLSPYLTNSFLIFNEASGAKMRAFGSVLINWFWTLGQIFVGVMAYLLSNNWRYLLLLGVGFPLLLTLPLLIMWTSESPMYLVSKRKFDDARGIIKNIGKVNRRIVPEFEFTEERYDKRRSGKEVEDKNYGFTDLIRYKSLRGSTLIASFLCFAIYFNYYGTIFALSHIQVNAYFLTVVLAITELVAYYCSGIMLQVFPRRLSFAICSILCCASNMLFVFFPVPEGHKDNDGICFQVCVQLALSIINRFSVSIAMAISGTYTNEIFPTSVRAIGTGLIIFLGRLGSFMATIIISLCLTVNANPILVFGAVCFPAILASFLAKETKGLPLPEYIEEEREKLTEVKKSGNKNSIVRDIFNLLRIFFSPSKEVKYVNVKVKDDKIDEEESVEKIVESKYKIQHLIESEFDI